MLEDKNGNLWIGTDGGLSQYTPAEDGTGGTFTHFTEKEGLSNNGVFSTLEDKNGNLWFGTVNGLTLFLRKAMDTPNSKEEFDWSNISSAVRTFEKQDGLKGLDFTNAALMDSHDQLWWGTNKALTTLNMNTFKLSDKVPDIQLNYVEIGEQFLDFRNQDDSLMLGMSFDSVKPFYNYPLHLKLPFDRNHLTFHFSAIDWAAPHKIKYSYKIEGLNDRWSIPKPEADADFRNIPYGTFTFKVRTIGEAQIWSEPFEYTFTILPPWWHTWWPMAYMRC